MGLFDRSASFAVGFAAGFGTGIMVRDYVPNLKDVASPALKFLLKSGIIAAERSREGLARFGETLQDLMAEAQTELRERKVSPTRKKPAVSKRAHPAASKPPKARAPRPAKEAEVIPLHKGRTTS